MEIANQTTAAASITFEPVTTLVDQVIQPPAPAPAATACLTPADVMKDMDGVRGRASNDWKQYEIAGRDAHIERMSELYKIYFEVMQHSVKDEVLGKMRAELGGKVRKSTKDAALFVRYTFSNFDAKQIHVAATGLEHALKKQVRPPAFIGWVKSFKDKWEGIRAAAMTEGAGGAVLNSWQAGMDFARGAEAVETIKLNDWAEAEEARIYVAVNNGGGTADLKPMALSPTRVQAVLAIYAADIKERNKPKVGAKRVLSDAEQKVKRNYEAKLAYESQMIEEHQFNIKQFERQQKYAELEAEKGKLEMANSERDAIKVLLKSFKAKATSGSDGVEVALA